MFRLPSSKHSSRWYKGHNCRVQKHIHYPSLRCLRLRGIGGQCLKLPWDLTTPYTGTCFDYLLRSLLHGGTRGLTAGYKGLHFPKCTTMKNTFFRSKALDLPKLNIPTQTQTWTTDPWGPNLGGALFCAPSIFLKCTTLKNTFFKSKALNLPKLKIPTQTQTWTTDPWSPKFGVLFFVPPQSFFFGPGGIAHRLPQVDH